MTCCPSEAKLPTVDLEIGAEVQTADPAKAEANCKKYNSGAKAISRTSTTIVDKPELIEGKCAISSRAAPR